MATHVERSIEVDVPVRTAYDQWTQFEDFPRFMGGVQQVRQVGDTMTHWVAEIAGVRREWDAEILEQVPDQKVAWAATTGATNAGTVYFDAVGEDRTRVRLTLDYEPEGIVEKIGDMLDVVERQAVADLDRFKQFIESRGTATGGWRGSVDGTDVPAVGADAESTGAGAAGDIARARVQGRSGSEGVGGTGTSGRAGEHGDARVVDAQSTGHGSAERTGIAAGAASSSEAGVAGFGTDTGLPSSPTSGVLTGDPGSTRHTDDDDAERTGAAAGAGSTAGVTGFGTDTGMSSSPTSGVLTGDPGARTASHGGTGSGDLVGEPDADWTHEPGARSGVTEAATDPVGEDWAGEPGAGDPTTSRQSASTVDDSLTGASTDPAGESWDAGAGDAGSRSATTGSGEPYASGTGHSTPDEAWAPGAGGPGERRGVGDTGDERVVERNYADENISTDDVVARDFANRPVSGGGVVERDFANRDITERDIENRGIVTGMGGAPADQPTGVDALDAPGPADGVGAKLDPLDPRAGTADDPDNPSRPNV